MFYRFDPLAPKTILICILNFHLREVHLFIKSDVFFCIATIATLNYWLYKQYRDIFVIGVFIET